MSRVGFHSSLPLLVFVTLSMGCSAPDARELRSEVVVTDSAGVAIIHNGVLPMPDPEAPLSPSLEIGVVEGDAAYQLFRVSSIRRLSDGAIVLANAGSREIRIFEPDGTHRATAGRAGDGPGEFRFPSNLFILPGDTIQVQDFLNRKYFTANGEFLRQETGDRQALIESAESLGGSTEGGTWLADGSFFAPVFEPAPGPWRPGPPFRPGMTLMRMTSDLRETEVLGHFEGILQELIEVGGRFGVIPVVPPFATDSHWALGSPDGTIVVADNAHPQVHRFHSDGTRSIVRWTSETQPVTPHEVEEWKAWQRGASWTQPRLAELERAWAVMEVPTSKPHYERVATGSDGTLWVPLERPVEQTLVWVFGGDGHFRRTLTFPGEFRVHDSGPGWVLGLTRDENEVEYVRLYEF